MKIINKIFSGPTYINGIRTSLFSRVLFVLFMAMVAIAFIAYFLHQNFVYGIAAILGILSGILGYIGYILDLRRDRAGEKRKYAENAPNLPPEFFHPKKSASTDIDTNGRYAAYDVNTARCIGEIAPKILVELIHTGEEWKEETNDITIIPEMIEIFREKGASPDLLKFLRNAIGQEDSINLRWIKLQ